LLESDIADPIFPAEFNYIESELTGVMEKKDIPFEEPVEVEVEPAGDAGGQPAGEDTDPTEAALARAEEDLARHKEAMLRMQAEMDNLRKRVMRDLEKSRKLSLERIMKDLLQVWDSLERGLGVNEESLTVESLKEGQQLTLKMLEKVLADHDLEVIDPAGQPFDPVFHEAVTVLPSADVEENTVIEVLQKGFKLHDRLIRPAMVVVSGRP
jgi:molecular chaperone GrpE